MKNIEQQQEKYAPDATCLMWNSDTKSFDTWYIGDCEFCGNPVDTKTGECKEYKCWI